MRTPFFPTSALVAALLVGCAAHDRSVEAPSPTSEPTPAPREAPVPAEEVPSNESEASQAGSSEDRALSSLGDRLDGARKALKEDDRAGARERIADAIEQALAEIGDREDAAALELLDLMGRFALDAGELRSADRAWERVLEVHSRTLPDDHPDLQVSRSNRAVTLRALGDLQGTRALEEKVLEIRSRTLPDDHPDLQRARQNLAGTIFMLGDLQGARELFEKVLDVCSRTLPDDHPDLQRARSNLAAMKYTLGDLQGARALQEMVLEVRTRTLPDDHSDLQKVRSNLAVTIEALGDLEGARQLKEKVLEVFSRTLPDDHPDLQKVRQNLAVLFRALGDLRGERALEEKVLEVVSRTLPDDHPDLQLARENLAGTTCKLGDIAVARTIYEKVLEVRSRTLPDDHPDLRRTRQGLAVAIKELGDLQAARALEEMVLESCSRTLPDDHPDLQLARLNLANTIRELGDLQVARALEEKVLEIRTKTLSDDHPDLQLVRENLAVTMHALGDLAGSRALEEKVLEVRSRTLPDDHPDLQRVRGNLASTMLTLGDLPGARGLFEAVLEVRLRTLPEGHPDLQLARENLAWSLAHEFARADRIPGESGEAERCAELIEAICRAQTDAARAALLGSSAREAEARCAQLSERLSTAISFAGGLGVFDPSPELDRASFLLGETTRGAALTSAMLLRRAACTPRWAELREELRRRSDALAGLVQQGATSESFREALARREDAERALVALAREASGGKVAGFEFELEGLVRTLGESDAVVAYRHTRRWSIERSGTRSSVESLCAFVVRHDAAATLTCVDLGPIGPIEQAVHDWREDLGVAAGRGVGAKARPAATLSERGEALRRLVLDPLAPELVGARRLILVLDDVLHLVPFDALPSHRATDGLVGDHLQIETRTTLTELLEAASPPTEAGGLVAIGDVAFESTSGDRELPGVVRGGSFGGFGPLPATGEEVEALAETFADQGGSGSHVAILRGPDANREKVIELAPQARWLHVATHGWFARESIRSWADPEPLDRLSGLGSRLSGEEQVRGMSPMLLCGLALAGANLPEDGVGRAPGLITAEELAGLDLTNCELAVLSACDTNVGERRAGQGVHSLQMALQMAGARSVITSLWKVPDEATRELMVDFYRRIWVEEKPKARALWEAKMRIRDTQDERGKPIYSTRDWAAWVLTGDPR